MEEITKEATRDETELKKRCQDITLEEAENCILSGLKSAARSVIAIGYYLKCIRDGKLYRDAGYDTIWDYAQNTYGFSKSTASRYMARNDKFSVDGNSPVLAKEYRDYSKAQLQEMLTLDDNQLEQVTPDMTVKAIREIRTSPAKEIPYFEIPGQMSFAASDFLDVSGDGGEAGEVEPRPGSSTYMVNLGDFFPDLETEVNATGELPTVAMPQREEVRKPDDLPEPAAKRQQSGEDCCKEAADEENEDVSAETEEETLQEPLTDLQLLRDMLDRQKVLLEKFLRSGVEENDEHIRKQKLLVGALASVVTDLEGFQEEDKPARPGLPELKNNGQRKEWLRKYQDWGIWYTDENIGCRYYKYDFDNGARLIAEEYSENGPRGEYTVSFLHLVGGPEPPRHPKYGYGKWNWHKTYSRHPDSETELIEFLKEVQRR